MINMLPIHAYRTPNGAIRVAVEIDGKSLYGSSETVAGALHNLAQEITFGGHEPTLAKLFYPQQT